MFTVLKGAWAPAVAVHAKLVDVAGADLGEGCRGAPLPGDDLRLSKTTVVFCKKKKNRGLLVLK